MEINKINRRYTMTTLIDHPCPICPEGTPFKVRYPAQFSRESLQFIARKTPDHMHFRIVRCDGCGLIFSNPIIPAEDIIKLYKESGFIAEPQLDNMRRDYLNEFQTILPLAQKDRLLEVGCSNGFFLEEIKKLGFKETYGIEPGQEAVQKAAPTIRPFILNDILRPGLFPDGHFDVVCFFQVFDHIIDPNDFLHTLHRYLKPQGVLFAIHHNIRSLMPAILGAKASTYDISHIHLWDHDTMRKILEKNGFRLHVVRNTANSYQLDHVLRMLPLPDAIKQSLRHLTQKLNLSDVSIKAKVENMACVAIRTT
jgi:2-polyprenyl-3-methyl-5-hydroxy-6-metoxy-1,4-benzoquinol methylase